jgi:TrmH family RNA methyltransferase
MLGKLENVAIILSGTKHPGNVGSVARAMHNMGLTDLRLATPRCSLGEESERLAKSGITVLRGARKFRSLRGAVRGIHLLVGTTAKSGGNRSQCHGPRDLVPGLLAQSERQKVGILFGPEDTGLVDDDLIFCQKLVRIPTTPEGKSINLTQAAMILAYELYLGHLESEPARVPKLASIEQREAMFGQLETALLKIGFLHPQNFRHMMFAIRRIFGRTGLEVQDVGILRGIARQIHWYSRASSSAPDQTATGS